MYEVDRQDKVIELTDIPQSDTGAPLPILIADEQNLVLAYIVSESDASWDGTNARVLCQKTQEHLLAIVKFTFPYAHMFGPPNDEAFEGHPLADRGLLPYSVCEVKDSSWIRKLEKMNSVHSGHNPMSFADRRHFIFAFHDSIFECVANGLEVALHRGSLRSALEEITRML